MKSKITILLLLIVFISHAQSDKFENQILKTNNSDLINLTLNQKLVYSKIKYSLGELKNSKIFDSVTSSKFVTLSRYYNSLTELSALQNRAIKTKEEMAMVEDYTRVNLATIDSIYALCMNREITEVVSDKKTNTTTSTAKENQTAIPADNASGLDSQPFHESCAGSPLGAYNCTINYIRKEIGEFFSVPELRVIKGVQVKIFIQFMIDKKGGIVCPIISKSGGVFEYDMEAIKTFEILSKLKFNPGIQNEKPVNYSYHIPITISLMD